MKKSFPAWLVRHNQTDSIHNRTRCARAARIPRWKTLIPVILIVVMSTSVCNAQRRDWYRGSGGGNSYNYGYSSTLAEGAQRGRAEMIRAGGEANLNNSEAMINVEQARSKYIDNQLQWTKTYYERKRMYAAYRDEQAAKSRQNRELYNSRYRRPGMQQLTADQLDPATGYVNWPEGLRIEEFVDSRKEIEELLLLKAHTSSTPGISAKIHSQARSMQDELKNYIRDMPSIEYLAARKFLDGLAYSGYNTGG